MVQHAEPMETAIQPATRTATRTVTQSVNQTAKQAVGITAKQGAVRIAKQTLMLATEADGALMLETLQAPNTPTLR